VLTLRALERGDEHTFRRAYASFAASDPRWQFAHRFDPSEPFETYLARVEAWTRGEDLAGWVPMTYLVGVVLGEIVGRVSIRHVLNEQLRIVGGHIGYDVLREHRRRGYATEMLGQAIPRARALGIEDILITTDDDNVGSIRTIERHGGVLLDVAEIAGAMKRRYVIPGS
jgi:predicted acetyltransferase